MCGNLPSDHFKFRFQAKVFLPEKREDQTEQKKEVSSVISLGDLLHFGQLFKACGNDYFAQIAHILDNFCKVVEIFNFSREIILGNLYRHFATFYWSHWKLERQE